MRNMISIVFDKGLDAKLLGHLHERDMAVRILQNLALSISAKRDKTRPVSAHEKENLRFIKESIRLLME